MWSTLQALVAVGLLTGHVAGTRKEVHDVTTIYNTVYDTVTLQNTRYVDVTVYNTHTDTVKTTVTECVTTTLHYTVSVTDTKLATVTNTRTDSATVTNTATALATITNTDTDSVTVTDTDSVTVTNTDTTTTTVPTTTSTTSTTSTTTSTTSTTSTTTSTTSTTSSTTSTTSSTSTTTSTTTTATVFTTTFDPCPKSCSVYAQTVNLYFWPTDRPYTYPTTYVDPTLSYTFTSPSVYMYIPSAVGLSTVGNQTVGPKTSQWMLPLALHQVSTIALPSGANASLSYPVTRQLTLADLWTDCPKSVDPTAIATMSVDPRCNPILAAPEQVRSWGWPCNACGRFGLFDPPYAVPTLTGALVVEPTTTRATVITGTLTATPPPSLPTPGPSVTGTVTIPTEVPTSTDTADGGEGEGTATSVVEGPSASEGTEGPPVTAGAGRASWNGNWLAVMLGWVAVYVVLM